MSGAPKKLERKEPKPTEPYAWLAPVLIVVGVLIAAIVQARKPAPVREIVPPAQAVIVDRAAAAVIGHDEASSIRGEAFESHFNPHGKEAPFFQVFDKSFLQILGRYASIYEISSDPTFAFAHEAPIYHEESDMLFFASNGGGALGFSDWHNNNKVLSLNLTVVDDAIWRLKAGQYAVNVPATKLDLHSAVQMTNGGTGPYKNDLLLINSGRANLHPNIVAVNPYSPHNVTVLLDNYYGRSFNSLNDIKIHPSGKIFFTDVTYGHLNEFRPEPLMPNQVYRFDPETHSVRVVADGFSKPNGIAFSPDGKTAYIADTGAAAGVNGLHQTLPATIYAMDVHPKSHAFTNRRVLAYVDAGVPDGIQTDTKGNVYSACGDGVHVWNPEGELLGKFFLGRVSANMVFAGRGRLVILAETKVYMVHFRSDGQKLSWP